MSDEKEFSTSERVGMGIAGGFFLGVSLAMKVATLGLAAPIVGPMMDKPSRKMLKAAVTGDKIED